MLAKHMELLTPLNMIRRPVRDGYARKERASEVHDKARPVFSDFVEFVRFIPTFLPILQLAFALVKRRREDRRFSDLVEHLLRNLRRFRMFFVKKKYYNK